MNRRDKAKIMLDSLDISAPTNINWNLEEMWLNALEKALKTVETAEAMEMNDW